MKIKIEPRGIGFRWIVTIDVTVGRWEAYGTAWTMRGAERKIQERVKLLRRLAGVAECE